MKPSLVWEIMAAVNKDLIARIADEAAAIDVSRYNRVRFCIELNIDPARETLTSYGLEVRKRGEHK